MKFENNFLTNNEFFLNEMDMSWLPFFEKNLNIIFPLLKNINEEYKKNNCSPDKKNIFRLFREISAENIKVIILGQDPYHISGVADGLAFSTQKKDYMPASLKNIFLEISSDLNCVVPKKTDLLQWVKEGVFLLNSCLSVRDGFPLSHFCIWKDFFNRLIKYLIEKNPDLIWVFFGKRLAYLPKMYGIGEKKSIITSHPSPFSAAKGFFFSKPFSRTNELLKSLGKKEIDWLTILKNDKEKL